MELTLALVSFAALGLVSGQSPYSFLSSSVSSSVYESRAFSVYPSEQIRFSGALVTLLCQIPRSVTCHDLHWYRGDSLLSSCNSTTIKGDRISAILVGNTYMLRINPAKPRDTDEYSCGVLRKEEEIFDYDTDYLPTLGSSPLLDYEEGFTTLTVLDAAAAPPVCDTSHNNRAGDNVSLTCRSPASSYHSLLVWFFNSSGISMGPQLTKSTDSFTINKTLLETDNFETFTCIVVTSKYSFAGPSCSFMPLQIDFVVAVTPHVVEASEGDPANFTCVIQSVSAIRLVQWYIVKQGEIRTVNPTCVSCRYKIRNDGRVFQISQVLAAEDDGLQVKCKASNTQQETVYSPWGLVLVNIPKEFGKDSHSHVPSTVVGILASVCLSFVGLALIHCLHKKRLLQRPLASQNQSGAAGSRYEGLEMKPTGGTPVQPACGSRNQDIALTEELVHESPTNQLQSSSDDPPPLPPKDEVYESVSPQEQGQGQGQVDQTLSEAEVVYDVPRPVSVS